MTTDRNHRIGRGKTPYEQSTFWIGAGLLVDRDGRVVATLNQYRMYALYDYLIERAIGHHQAGP
jgi:hypothetical protein